MQPGIEPGSVVTPLALICSALDRCATREPSKDERVHTPTLSNKVVCVRESPLSCVLFTRPTIDLVTTDMVGSSSVRQSHSNPLPEDSLLSLYGHMSQ